MIAGRWFVLVVTVLCTVAELGAQATGKFVTSPSGYLTKAGSGHNFYLGAWREGRVMYGDGELVGQALGLTRVDFRADPGRAYTAASGAGRSWSTVSLSIAHTALSKWSRTFSANVVGPPTAVFSGKMSWPALSGKVSSATWGLVQLPFAKVWSYDGKQDLLLDFAFVGGALANQAAWGGSFRGYWLDGVVSGDVVEERDFGWLPSSPFAGSGCNDTAITSTVGAYAVHRVRVYANNHPTKAWQGKASLQASTFRTAPGASVIALLTAGGSGAGAALGVGCNRLYVLPQALVARVSAVTDTSSSAWSGQLFPTVPQTYPKVAVGQATWLQAAWLDSKTGRFSLTVASRLALPPVPDRLARHTVYRGGLAARTGFLLSSAGWTGQLLPRYGIR